jgi:hypothetical protein
MVCTKPHWEGRPTFPYPTIFPKEMEAILLYLKVSRQSQVSSLLVLKPLGDLGN